MITCVPRGTVKSPCPRPLNFFSRCLPFCWTLPCLLPTSQERWTTRYLRLQHIWMIRQFSVEETKSAKGKAGRAQSKQSARFRNTLLFSINLSGRNPAEVLKFRATHTCLRGNINHFLHHFQTLKVWILSSEKNNCCFFTSYIHLWSWGELGQDLGLPEADLCYCELPNPSFPLWFCKRLQKSWA